MSKGHKRHRSHSGEPNVLTTAPTVPPPAEISVPSQEKTMEATQDQTSPPSPEPSPAPSAPPPEGVEAGPTAKEMAAAEEANAARQRAIIALREKEAQPKAEQPTIIQLAAQGMDVLHDAIRAHSNQPTHPDYVPPPRTARQMDALREELEAGQRASARAKEQQAVANAARARSQAEDRAKEGFTTPVYRPGDVVPDPTVAAPSGFVAGSKGFDVGR